MNNKNSKKKKEKHLPIKQPKAVKRGILPAFPSVWSFSGLSKSGKSSLVAKVLTDPGLLKNYFHTIVFFSPTSDADDTITSKLELPEENIFTDFTQEDLLKIINARRNEIKIKGYNWVAKNNRMLIILDDVISHTKFLKSQVIVDLTATVRHLLVQTFFCVQSFNRVPRVCRLNLRCICFFEANRNEVEVLTEEVCPAGLKKDDFRELISYATEQPYSFLCINRDAPFKTRYRKNFDTILEII